MNPKQKTILTILNNTIFLSITTNLQLLTTQLRTLLRIENLLKLKTLLTKSPETLLPLLIKYDKLSHPLGRCEATYTTAKPINIIKNTILNKLLASSLATRSAVVPDKLILENSGVSPVSLTNSIWN